MMFAANASPYRYRYCTHTGAANFDQPTSDLVAHELFGPPSEFSSSKAAFLTRSAGDYGYGLAHEPAPPPGQLRQQQQRHQQPQQRQRQPRQQLTIDALRALELRRLHGQAYLDHGGSALYSERQLDAALAQLKDTLLANPHSSGGGGGSGG